MFKSIVLCSGLLVCVSAMGEMHLWTFKNGKTLEAEFVAYTGDQISLKNIKGKVKKVAQSLFSDEDLKYVELLNPPKLDLNVGKTTVQRIYPPTYNNQELPRSGNYTFTVTVKQRSTKVYSQALTLELFIIGEENAGDKNILFGYHKEQFHLEKGSKSVFEIKMDPITITEYVLYGQLRGDAYSGYIVLVTDSRGEVVASKAKKDDWLNLVEHLRKVPVGKTFDSNGDRCWPSRPGRFY